jgi:sigma-B regulation protein RsbU (phosphoserine phosphatase)
MPLAAIIPVLFQPLALGIFVSAYRQTIETEAAQYDFYIREYHDMRDELQTAHDMQMSLLPTESPSLQGFTLHGHCTPANNVGGDYYAYRWLDREETKLGILVADVSGKAMEAAVTALRFNEMLRYEIRDQLEPNAILNGLNDSLEGQIPPDTFITCVVAVLDVPASEITIAKAGHCYPLLYRKETGTVSPIEVGGVPLGLPSLIRPDRPYEADCLAIGSGDGLVLYTDGVVEAHNADGELYDDPRLMALLEKTGMKGTAETWVETVVADVDGHIRSSPRTDDVTVVAVRRQ